MSNRGVCSTAPATSGLFNTPEIEVLSNCLHDPVLPAPILPVRPLVCVGLEGEGGGPEHYVHILHNGGHEESIGSNYPIGVVLKPKLINYEVYVLLKIITIPLLNL